MKRIREASSASDYSYSKFIKLDDKIRKETSVSGVTFKVPEVPLQSKGKTCRVNRKSLSDEDYLYRHSLPRFKQKSIISGKFPDKKRYPSSLQLIKAMGRNPLSRLSLIDQSYYKTKAACPMIQAPSNIESDPDQLKIKQAEIRKKLKASFYDIKNHCVALVEDDDTTDIVIDLSSGECVFEGKFSALGHYGSVPELELENLKTCSVPTCNDVETLIKTNKHPTKEDISELNETINNLNDLVQIENDPIDLNQSYTSITTLCSDSGSTISDCSSQDMSMLNYSHTKAAMNIALANVQEFTDDRIMHCKQDQIGKQFSSRCSSNKENVPSSHKYKNKIPKTKEFLNSDVLSSKYIGTTKFDSTQLLSSYQEICTKSSSSRPYANTNVNYSIKRKLDYH